MKNRTKGKKVEEKVGLLKEGTTGLTVAENASKMGTVLVKLNSGFYDRPEVKEKIVEGLIRDFKLFRSSN